MDLATRLCYIFGTEEAVNNRRQLVFLRETVNTLLKVHKCECGFCEITVICSGSLGEGVNYPPSDDDIMIVNESKSWRVYNCYEEAVQNRGLYMIPSEHSPGFCLLQGTKKSEFAFLSSKLFRERFVRDNGNLNAEEHGPCASFTIGTDEFDYALCLPSSIWTTMADEWVMRRRSYGIPSQELIRTIVMGGCHFVPIGNPDSLLRDAEWRVSFSLAERSLIHKFNHVQFLMYNLLKLILKKVIEVIIPNVLCSYFIKTVMFFVIENTSQTLWVNERLEECYTKCMWLLHLFIDKMECPNYFIPANNMMRRKLNANNRGPLLDIVEELMTLGIVGSLRRCDDVKAVESLSPLLQLAQVEFKQDRDFCDMYLLKALDFDFLKFIHINTRQQNVLLLLRTLLLPVLSNFKTLSDHLMSLVTQLIFRQMGMKCIQISQHMTEGNKSRYQMLQQGQDLLSKGCNTDISSGRLQLASYMYLTGRFHHALEIIKSVLSKHAPYVMSDASFHASQGLYLEILCKKHYSIIDKLKRGWALNVQYSKPYIVLAPTPIKLFIICHFVDKPISPLLHGLCFYQ